VRQRFLSTFGFSPPGIRYLLVTASASERSYFTLFLIIAKVAFEILLRSLPRMIGDLAIAQSPKCVRSSAAVSFPLPSCCCH
jgi:hypothetical protein